ncbi:olfactory receptor 5V1-like [Lissotriton helveticus]
MAFDRYVAICNPLRYTSIMSMSMCIRLALVSWLAGFLVPIPHTVFISQLSFCESHIIDHFFCDATALLKISCSNTSSIEIVTYVTATIVALMSFNVIIISYINIISLFLNIKSKGGRHKAFSTCLSHLTVVLLFYGSIFGTYVRPPSTYSVNKISSLLYIAVTPLCNPMIYTLKNTDFKNALMKSKIRR